MKTKLINRVTRSDNQMKSFKSGYVHGYNGIGDKWGAIKNDTLLGYKLLTLAYFSSSAIMDHCIGTNIVFDKEPTQDLVLTVNGISKTLKGNEGFGGWNNWKKVPITANDSHKVGYHYNDGKMNEDFFKFGELTNGSIIRISLQTDTPVNAVLWSDEETWIDSNLWTETIEYVEARWDDNAIWSDSSVWRESIPSTELNEWIKLAEKLKRRGDK